MADVKKSDDTLVTKKMLMETRSELKSDIASLKLEMKSGFNSMDSKLEQVLAAVHSVKAIVEDQENRNKYVLDGYASLNHRLEKLERPN